jgi:hypothetical protein
MPRKAAITPNKHLHTTIPADLAARLDLYLWSEVEGRVPQGAYQQFICVAIQKFFSERSIDIGPMIGLETPVILTGTPEALATLTTLLEKENA